MKKTVIVALHIGYWIIFLALLFFFYLLIIAGRETGPKHTVFFNWSIVMTGFAIVPGLLSFYTFYTVLFDRFFRRKRIAALAGAGLLVVLLASVVGGALLTLIFPHFGIAFTGNMRAALEEMIVISFGAGLNGIVGLVMKGFVTSYGDIRIKEELNRKNFEVELALVKSQLSPHFLFNTINNIDVLIGIDAARASEYLNKLSDIMRFMLYETKAALIPLEDELHYIRKYIDLQRIRTANPDYIEFRVTGEAPGMLIPPMLFIPFIENAFKHALPRKNGNGITIALQLAADKIIFECKNDFTLNSSKEDDAGGLGNELMKKRLELLYPGRHELSLHQHDNAYTVRLIINTHEH